MWHGESSHFIDLLQRSGFPHKQIASLLKHVEICTHAPCVNTHAYTYKVKGEKKNGEVKIEL